MGEANYGVRKLLTFSNFYDPFQKLIGAYKWRNGIINQYVIKTIPSNSTIIDIGCGTSDILGCLPRTMQYYGFDKNHSFIRKAQKRFAYNQNASFYCDHLREDLMPNDIKADVVLALGILHHLEDEECKELFRVSQAVLKPNGLLLTVDPVYHPNQSSLAKFMVSKDRGINVRTEEAYTDLAKHSFQNIETVIDMRPLRIPFTGIIMKSSNPQNQAADAI